MTGTEPGARTGTGAEDDGAKTGDEARAKTGAADRWGHDWG